MARLLVVAATGAAVASGASLTALERQHFAAHLQMSESWLSEELSGLSAAQLRFRPAPGTWNILEVLDHLLVAEPIYWQDLQNAMKAPPAQRKPSGTDEGVLWYGIDRTQRQKAIPAEQPNGQLLDARAGLATLRKLHAEMLRYVRQTDDDLRGHIVEREDCDGYQWLLLISAHEQRHVLQISEIKANAKFPAK